MDKPRPALRGRYFLHNPLAHAAVRVVDALLPAVTAFSRQRGSAGEPPRRILVSHLSQLGDVVVATSVLPLLKDAYPDAKIGFLVGSWSRMVVEGHPMIEWIHTFDHWGLSRARVSRREKLRRHSESFWEAVAQIREVGYDLAIDAFPYPPNSLPLLWRAGIPRRIAYTSAGFGALATDRLDVDWRQSAFERHLELLRLVPIPETDVSGMAPLLPEPGGEAEATLAERWCTAGVDPSRYIVCHVGSGASIKEWPIERWRALAGRLAGDGWDLLFTGAGDGDRALVRQATHGLPRCTDLCGELKWPAFVAAIRQARLLISVDTVARHVAGAVNTPCVVLLAGFEPYLWKHPSAPCTMLYDPVACVPCHIGRGCPTMDCIRNVSADTVYDAAMQRLQAATAPRDTSGGS